jgi:hypothetical protein
MKSSSNYSVLLCGLTVLFASGTSSLSIRPLPRSAVASGSVHLAVPVRL